MYLIPYPKKMEVQEGAFVFRYGSYVCFNGPVSPKLRRQAVWFVGQIEAYLGYEPELGTGEGKAGDIVISVDEQAKRQSYILDSTKERLLLTGDEEGIWYGMQTLLQMLKQEGSTPAKVRIEDSPGILNRGYYFDSTRGRIPRLEWLKDLADKMAFYKLNQLQLYIEHTYLFRDISELWRDDTPLTAAEIMEFDGYCRERNIELVPSLSSFGHLEKLLSSKTYCHLCELEEGGKLPFSVLGRMNHHTINVTDREGIELIKSMLLEFMGLFSSRQFNICADETFDLGRGRSKAAAEKYGKDRLYINYIKEIAEFVLEQGRRPMFWGDIVVGFPELIAELPREMICLNWGYGGNQREDETRILAEAGATQYCCPGCSGWNEFVNLYHNSYNNIMRMCSYASKHGAIGILNTDWGDFLHINHPDLSRVGLIYGAAFSWNQEAPSFEELNRQISLLEYRDRSQSLVGIAAKAEGNSAFGWNPACRFKELKMGLEWFEKNNTDYLKDSLKEMEGVDKKNAALLAIREELYACMGEMEEAGREAVLPFLIGIDGMLIFNCIGKAVTGVEYGLKFENMPDNAGLAAQLEQWFYHYKKAYRKVSKEGELYRIQEIICFYGNWLREH